MAKAETDLARSGHWLRDTDDEDSAEVGYVELFFDLVFVFACTRLSRVLEADLTVEGALRSALLLVAVWWVWVHTALAANWLDPDRTPVRFLMFALMLAGLVMSVSLPEAFGDHGLVFALAYVAMQVGRTAFMVWALARAGHDGRRTYVRMGLWLAAAGVAWIAGAFAPGGPRMALWTLALGIEVLAPAVGFRIPGLGRSAPEDWDIAAPHFAERCALFVIITLGESLLVIGGTMDALDWTAARVAGFVAALGASVAMWWIYFDVGAGRGERALRRSSEPGRLARVAYTYFHVPIVAGIVLAAVGDAMTLAHPREAETGATAIVLLGGPALFLIGTLLFKLAVMGRTPASHLIGLGILAALGVVARAAPPVALSWAALGALAAVATVEANLVRGHGRAPAPTDARDEVAPRAGPDAAEG